MKGHRFESGVGPEHHGEWVSVQMERFKSACLSFQHLARATPILGNKPPKQPPGSWGPTFGFPRLPLMECTLICPARDFVWKTIRGMPMWVAGLPKGLCARSDQWRRGTPGIPGSQEHNGDRLEVPRLWELPRRRIRIPERPPAWQAEVAKIRPMLSKLHAQHERGDCSSQLWELVLSEGAFTKKGVQACTSRLYYERKRIEALEGHNQHAMRKRQHFAGLWGAKERPKCRICGKVGYASRQLGWLTMECGGWSSVGAKEVRDITQQIEKDLRAQRATVTALDAETRQLATGMI